MSYGPNSKLVEEVVEFVRAGSLLVRDGQLPEGVQPINDFNEAQRLAWEGTFGPDELTWTDIREDQMRRPNALTYGLDWYKQREHTFLTLIDRFTVQGKHCLPASYNELVDDVVADLYNVVKARALMGRQHWFSELVLEIYRAGAWPCGWRDYPKGELVAFVPPA